MEKKHLSVGEALKWGFKTFFDNIIFFLLVGLIYVGVYFGVMTTTTLAMSFLARRMSEDSPVMIILLVILGLIFSIVFIWLLLGLMKIMFDLYDYGKAEIKTLFSQGHLVAPFMAASLLFTLLISLGFGLFIIPGIYFMCRYFFFSYAMVDKNFSIVESFKESSRLTEGARWQILGLLIVSWLLNIIPLLIFATMLASVYAYRQQQENTLHLPAVSK